MSPLHACIAGDSWCVGESGYTSWYDSGGVPNTAAERLPLRIGDRFIWTNPATEIAKSINGTVNTSQKHGMTRKQYR